MTKLTFFKIEGFRPRFLVIVCVVQALHFAGSSHAFAHQGERIIPVFEITDDMLELIDLDDGSIDEWEALFEPSVRALDFIRSTWTFANSAFLHKFQVCDDSLLRPPSCCGLFDRPGDGFTERFSRHGSTGFADGRQHGMSPVTRTALPHPCHEQTVRQHHEIHMPGLALAAA